MAHGEFTHVDIPIDDMERARSFYEALFGWKSTAIDGFPDYEMAQPGPAGMGAGFGVRGKTAPERPRLYVNADSIDEAVAKLAGVGGAVVVEKTEIPGMGWYGAITDSEGNEIGIFESLAG